MKRKSPVPEKELDHCPVCKEHIDGGEIAILDHISSNHTREDIQIAMVRILLNWLLETLLVVMALLAVLDLADKAGVF